MLRSSLCDYSHADILFKGTITAINTAARGQPNNGANRKIILKNCAPFTNCIWRISTQVRTTHDINVVMPIYTYIYIYIDIYI